MYSFRFSSSNYPESDRQSVLEEVFSPVCGLDIDISHCQGSIAIRGQALPQFSIAESRIGRYQASRSYRHICDGDDSVLMLIPRTGSLGFQYRGRASYTCSPGEFHLAPVEAPFQSWTQRQLHCITLSLPGAWLESRLSRLDDVLAKTSRPGDAGSLELLANYVQALVASGDVLTEKSARVSALHLRDLAVMALGIDGEAGEMARNRGVKAARTSTLRKFVRDNMANPKLDVALTSRHHHISPQYLSKLFHDSGTTFSDYLNCMRLDWVYDMLGNPAVPREKVVTLAYQVGFNNIAWFNRAFKRRFGMTPTEARSSSGVAPLA